MSGFLQSLSNYLVENEVACNEMVGATRNYSRLPVVATDEQLSVHKRDVVYIQFDRSNPVITLNLESVELILGAI